MIMDVFTYKSYQTQLERCWLVVAKPIGVGRNRLACVVTHITVVVKVAVDDGRENQACQIHNTQRCVPKPKR